MKTIYVAWRIEPNGAALYCESLPIGKGDYGYTSKAENALHLTMGQAETFCAYQRSVGRAAASVAKQIEETRKPRAKRAPKRLYFIEVTDVFGGEANYSWVTRHVITATTQRGAVNKFSRLSNMEWRNAGHDRYDSKSGATCFFVNEYDEESHKDLRYDTDERPEPRFPADMIEREKQTLYGALRIAPNGVVFWDQNAVRVVNHSGEVMARSRNLRGILDYARRSPVVKVQGEPHAENPANGFLAVHYADGATACALFADVRVMRAWIKDRRIFRSANIDVK